MYNGSNGLSVQDRIQSDSSRAKQARQLTQDEQQFARLVASIKQKGETPPDEEINAAGSYAQVLHELCDDLQDKGLDGFNNTLALVRRANRNVHAVLDIWETQQEANQKEDHRIKLDQRGKKVFITMTEDDIDELPDIEWLIAGILQIATVSMVYGDSNVGKTFYALHTAQCIARGMQWFGHDIAQGNVLYIYAEGIRGLKPRSQAWRKKYDVGKTDKIDFIGFPVHLIEERLTLLNTISSLENERHNKYSLIVIDTFSNCAGGISQNDQMEIAKVLATAHDIVRDYSAHVMVVHHTNNQGKFNGSAAFKNHVDTMIELKKSDADGPIVMRCEKQRDGEYFQPMLFELEVIDLGMSPKTLESITSCVMVLSQSKMPGVEKAEQERETMLDILKANDTLSQSKWMSLCSEQKVNRRTFEKHLEYLKARSLVTWQAAVNGKAIMYKAALSIEDIIGSNNSVNEE